MHELTLAESMMEIVESAAARAGVTKVTRVRLSVGALAHVESEALMYCCDIVSRSGVAEGARFEIERPPGRAQCNACGQNFVLDHLALGCPHCAAHNLLVLDGEQMKVVEMGFAE
jgi:hydrogenase nickel incorporation protein HypA/HybF